MVRTKSLFEVYCFNQSLCSGEKAFCAEENWTLWILIVKAVVASVNKRSIDESSAQYMLTTRLLLDYLEDDSARVWIADGSALLHA